MICDVWLLVRGRRGRGMSCSSIRAVGVGNMGPVGATQTACSRRSGSMDDCDSAPVDKAACSWAGRSSRSGSSRGARIRTTPPEKL